MYESPQLLNKYLMVDKPKYFYLPQNYADNKMRNYTTTNISSNNRVGIQPNSSLTTDTNPYQKQQNPIGSSFSGGQYIKNYSTNITQLHDRMDTFGNGVKKQETTVFSNVRGGNDAFELRSSVPVNQAKKPDIDFLRSTTYTPKPKGMMYGQSQGVDKQYNSVHTQGSDMKSSFEQTVYNFKLQKKLSRKDQYEKDSKNDVNKLEKQTKESKLSNGESKQMPYSPPSNQSSANLKHMINYQQDKKALIAKNTINGFNIGKSLGVGKFAQVFLAKHVVSNFICVLKRLSKQKIKEYQMENQVVQQIKIHAFISHPNIVQFYGVFNDEKYLYMILEYLQSGTLFDYLGDRHYLQEKQAVVFLRQISMAVKYLHNKGIAHRDIKPQNIIISYGLAKLCDFGWSARVLGARKTYCGTFDYAPPEILQRKQYDQTVDLWCIGVLAYELLTNKVPFEHKQRKITMQKILNVDKDKIVFPENISVRAKDFIQSLIRKNPEERLKAYKLLDHPFLKQYEQQS